MSANVVQHPSSRRRGPQRTESDEVLEYFHTALHFASAIRLMAMAGIEVDPLVLKQAENLATYRAPIRQFLGGKPLPEESAQ